MKDANTLFGFAPVLPLLGSAVISKQMGANTNLSLMFAVYAITWIGFFGYVIVMSRKQQSIKRDIDALQKQLDEKNKPPQNPRPGRPS